MAALTALQTNFSLSDTTSYSFVAEPIGTAGATRVVIVGFGARFTGTTAAAVSSVTIGGVTAQVRSSSRSGTATSVCGIASAAVPTGTTATIAIEYSRAASKCLIAVYHVDDMATVAPANYEINLAADPSASVDCPPNGFMIGVAVTGNNTSASWTNLTEDFDYVNPTENTFCLTAASDEFADVQRQRTITCDFANSSAGDPLGVFCSWGFQQSTIVEAILYPTGAGTSSQWTTNGDSTGWQCVDDVDGASDDDTTYVYSTTLNHTNHYTFTAPIVPAGSTMYGSRLVCRTRCVTSSFVLGPVVRCGGTNYASPVPNQVISSTSYIDWVFKLPNNPRTAVPWAIDDVNGVGSNALQQFGHLTGGGNEGRVTQCYMKVRYTPVDSVAGGLVALKIEDVNVSDSVSALRSGGIGNSALEDLHVTEFLNALRITPGAGSVPAIMANYRRRRRL